MVKKEKRDFEYYLATKRSEIYDTWYNMDEL